MTTLSLMSLKSFLRAARGQSQEQIIVEFLQVLIAEDETIDQGSVLINYPHEDKLVLFNEGDFLFSKKFLDPKQRPDYPTEFNYFSGIAGRAFREKGTKVYSATAGKDSQADFLGKSSIKNMICVPIMLQNIGDIPFGIVCVHNNDLNKKFDSDDVEMIESYVEALAFALKASFPKILLEKNVFIVHGRDAKSRAELETLLFKLGVKPRTLMDEQKKAQGILPAIEQLIKVCAAGFILVTPDDEGRLFGSGDTLMPRARENVIFEMGLLFSAFREFERVAVLLKKPVTMPSDLSGTLYEEFTEIADIEGRIRSKLEGWGLKPSG
jgi:predicted nucleotide-binding protein